MKLYVLLKGIINYISSADRQTNTITTKGYEYNMQGGTMAIKYMKLCMCAVYMPLRLHTTFSFVFNIARRTHTNSQSTTEIKTIKEEETKEWKPHTKQ